MEIKRPAVWREGKPTTTAKATVVRGAQGFIFLGPLTGRDPDTGAMPEGVQAQTKMAWKNAFRRLEEVGGSLENLCYTWIHLAGPPTGDCVRERIKGRQEAWEEYVGAEYYNKTPFAHSPLYVVSLGSPDTLVSLTLVLAIP